MTVPVTTAMERKLLTAIAQAPNGLSTSDLAKLYDPDAATMPRDSFARVAAGLGAILGDLLKRGLVVRRTLSAGWKLTDAGQASVEKNR